VNTRQYREISYESSALHALRAKLHAHPYDGNLNSSLYFREKSNSQSHMFDEHSMILARVQKVYWREYTGCSPIGESSWGTLAKVQWTFANWRLFRGYIGESLMDVRQWRKSSLRKSYWRTSGNPKYVHVLKIDIDIFKLSWNSTRNDLAEISSVLK
jgi:hypothetical protein